MLFCCQIEITDAKVVFVICKAAVLNFNDSSALSIVGYYEIALEHLA